MLNNENKKKARAALNKAAHKHQISQQNLKQSINRIYETRQESINLIRETENIINRYSNTPKSYDKKMGEICVQMNEYTNALDEVDSYEIFAKNTMIAAGVVAITPAAIEASKALVSVFREKLPDFTMKNSFSLPDNEIVRGITSAIDDIKKVGDEIPNGVVKAITYTVAGALFVGSALYMNKENKKEAEKALKQLEECIEKTAQINELKLRINEIEQETALLNVKIYKYIKRIEEELKENDYASLSHREKCMLGTLVNNTYTLVKKVNLRFDIEE